MRSNTREMPGKTLRFAASTLYDADYKLKNEELDAVDLTKLINLCINIKTKILLSLNDDQKHTLYIIIRSVHSFHALYSFNLSASMSDSECITTFLYTTCFLADLLHIITVVSTENTKQITTASIPREYELSSMT